MSSVLERRGTPNAWSSAGDGQADDDENKSLADRLLTVGPLIAVFKTVQANPRLVDCLVYLGFLALLTYVAIEVQDQPGIWPSSAPFHSAQVLQKRYGEKFLQIDSVGKFFEYLEEDFVSTLYPVEWYSGKQIAKDDLGFAGAGSLPDNFRIVGAAQLRQIRTQQTTCPLTYQRDFRYLVLSCVGAYSRYTQEEAPFGPIEKGNPRYSFSTAKENGENSYSGMFSTYNGGGYVTTFPANGEQESKNISIAKIRQMRADRYFDRQTRAMFVTVNLFNPSTGYITALRLILEHPASGGLHPSISMRHVPIGALYTDYAQVSTIIPEIILTVCVFLYMVWELNEASSVSFVEYFSRFWGIYDFFNFALFIVAYAFRWATYDRAKGLTFPPSNERFVNLEPSAWSVQMWRNVLAVNLVVCYLKMFKYVMQIPSLAHLFDKIFFTMTDILYLLICFAFIFWGFALSHFLAYGDEVAAFRTIPDTMIMLWRQMLGDLAAVDDMIITNQILGPLFFVIFTSFVSILLLTIFLGLLRESYVISDDQNDRIGLVQSVLQSAIAPYLGLVKDYQMRHDEADAALDAFTAQQALEDQIEKQENVDEKMMGWDKEHVESRNLKASEKREARKDILLQSLLTLTREARVVSRRVDTLMDSGAPTAADLPAFFD